ncbi:MAG: hypothetical protein RLZZ272_1600 [Actinomycetota bacterium]
MVPRSEPEVSEEVARALADGAPVVALESTILAHGLPRPTNLEVGRRLEALVRSRGAVPATIALLDGRVRIGLDEAALERICTSEHVVKASVRDLALAVATGTDAATTVASTAWLAHRAGIRVFATGGLGGVHREATTTFDESADLTVLAEVPILVVCAGAKSVLDVPATLERLETLGVAVVGWRTSRFPGFYVTDGGLDLAWRADDAATVARARRAADGLGVARAIVVANPVDPARQLDPALHDRALVESLAAAAEEGVSGRDVTPFLLERMERSTAGASLAANVAAVEGNVALASDLAVALASG